MSREVSKYGNLM